MVGLIKVYAAGCELRAPDGFVTWRDELQKSLEWHEHKIKCLNPTEYFNYIDKPPATTRQCSNYFMWLIDKSDIILCNLDYSDRSCGTSAEVQHAFDTKKPIIGFGTKRDTWYAWTADKCDVIFDTMQEAVEYILEYYCDVI